MWTVTSGKHSPAPQQNRYDGKYKVQKTKKWEDLGIMDIINVDMVII